MSCFVVEIDKDEEKKEYSSYFPDKEWQKTEEDYCEKYQLLIDPEICVVIKMKDKPCGLV